MARLFHIQLVILLVSTLLIPLALQAQSPECQTTQEPSNQLLELKDFLSEYAKNRNKPFKSLQTPHLICTSMDESVCDAELEKTAAIVKGVDEMVAGTLKRPENIYIELKPPKKTNNSFEAMVTFNNATDPLFGTTFNNRLPNPVEDVEESFQAVLIHEYGHHYFALNAFDRVKMADGTTLLDTLYKRNAARMDFKKRIDELNAKLDDPTIINEERTRLLYERDSLKDQDEESKEAGALSKLITARTTRILRATSELFSDALAVAYSEDPAIESKALLGLLPEDKRTPAIMKGVIEARRFDQEPESVEDQNTRPIIGRFGGVHTALSHSRYHIWKYHLSKAKTNLEKAKILKAVVDAAVVIDGNLFEQGKDGSELDYASLNRLFIEAFEKAMGTSNPAAPEMNPKFFDPSKDEVPADAKKLPIDSRFDERK